MMTLAQLQRGLRSLRKAGVKPGTKIFLQGQTVGDSPGEIATFTVEPWDVRYEKRHDVVVIFDEDSIRKDLALPLLVESRAQRASRR